VLQRPCRPILKELRDGANFALVHFGLGSLVHVSIVIWPIQLIFLDVVERMKRKTLSFSCSANLGRGCFTVLVFVISFLR
jgi:hypothetical protein